MKRLHYFFLAALVSSAPLHAQESHPAPRMDAAQAALSEFYDCTKRYAEKYSKSREPAQDIADAALSYCEIPRERARTLLIDKLSGGNRNAREQVNSLFPGIIEKARLLSIRTIVEARYEASSRAAATTPPAPVPFTPAPPPVAPLTIAPVRPAPSPAPAIGSSPPTAPASDVTAQDETTAPAEPPKPTTVVATPPTMKPDDAIAMPYIDASAPTPPPSGPARADPGAGEQLR